MLTSYLNNFALGSGNTIPPRWRKKKCLMFINKNVEAWKNSWIINIIHRQETHTHLRNFKFQVLWEILLRNIEHFFFIFTFCLKKTIIAKRACYKLSLVKNFDEFFKLNVLILETNCQEGDKIRKKYSF